MNVRQASAADGPWIADLLRDRWAATGIVLRGELIDAANLPALIAEDGGRRCGLATYQFQPDAVEIVSLDALEQFCGIGTALIAAAAALARARGTPLLRLATTNDNLDALRFYQRRGFVITAVRLNVLEGGRRLKPSIPALGSYGMPIRDEIELVCRL
jgi:ribosomal protein S18 acetylase RimI-like enzyme